MQDDFEVADEAINKVTVWAVTQLHFTSGELQTQLLRGRVEQMIVHRTAETLIKEWKKEGKIIFRKGQWHWQGDKK